MRNALFLLHRAVLAQAVCSAFTMATCIAQLQKNPDTTVPEVEKSLKLFLQTQDDDETTRYIATFRDLNGDGTPEAIVYLLSNGWCGSGGCKTLVLTRTGTSWRIVANITITRPPIRVLANSSNGWRNIGVWVQGGGIQPGYEAELRFDGKSYPRNPSVPPARRLYGKPIGEIVIHSNEGATLLYEKGSSRRHP